ncbi:oligosaccharide flippase family protein [Castellaniella hirudinis]|uniref:oligosaccharide flippase family protein n=1 Tax=Castellaniella hirudinis TaxID=1144617 RepID=UPI0039C0A77F
MSIHRAVASFLKNAGALYLVQIITLLAPLLEIPLLARTLGVSLYGQILFCQALAFTASLLVEYGFGINAAQQTALARGQTAVLNRLVSQVMLAKGLLAIPMVALMLLVWAVGALDDNPWHLALLGFVLAYFMAAGFSPMWYFQGREQMALPALLDAALRLLGLGLVALWVRGPQDFLLALPLLAIPPILSMAGLLLWCRRQVGPLHWDFAGACVQVRQGFHFFVYRSATNLAITAVPVLLGVAAGKRAVGEFAPAEKLIKGMTSLGVPFLTAIFPVFSRRLQGRAGVAALRLPLLVLLGVAVVATLGGALAWQLGPWALDLMLGAGYPGAQAVYLVLLPLAPLRILNQSIAMVLLIPAGRARSTSYVVLLFSMLGLAVGTGLSCFYGGVGMAAGLVGVETLLLGVMLLLARRTVRLA